MPLRSRHENGNWSLNIKIEVATKLRVEQQKGGRNLKRSQTKSLPKKLKLQPSINQGPQMMSRPEEELSRRNTGRNYF